MPPTRRAHRLRRTLPSAVLAALAAPLLSAVAAPGLAPDAPLAAPVDAPTERTLEASADVRDQLDLEESPFLDARGEHDPVADAAFVDDLEPTLVTIGLEHAQAGEHGSDHAAEATDDGASEPVDHAAHDHGVEGDDADASVAAGTSGGGLPATRRRLACVPDGGFRTVVVHARMSGASDTRGAHLGTIRSTLERSNQLVASSARASGGPAADLRVRCTSGGAISVASATVTSRDFDQIKRQLAAQGFDSPREKYLVFADFTSPLGVAGLADLYLDDRRSLQNHNNGTRAMYATVFGSRHFGTTIPLHELAHSMGAVQPSAPRGDRTAHCTGSGDVLCRGGSSTLRFDRHHDSYFSTATRAGQWLHHHWNLGWEGNRFVSVAGRPTPNLAPTARLTVDCTRATCTFDGTGSSDPDGRIVRHRVETGDGATVTGARSTHSFAANGTYEVRLTVTDDRGATAQVARSVRISGAQAPRARATSSCDGMTCVFDAGGSSDPDGGTITGVRWRLPDGRTSTASRWTVTFDEPGRVTAGLTVTDDDGWTGDTTVSARPRDPDARATDGASDLLDLGGALPDLGDGLVPELDVELPTAEGRLEVRVGDVGVEAELGDGLLPRVGLNLGGTGLLGR